MDPISVTIALGIAAGALSFVIKKTGGKIMLPSDDLARITGNEGLFIESIEEYRAAIEQRPVNFEAYNN